MGKKIALVVCAAALAALVFGAVHFTKKEEEVPIENAGMAVNAVQKTVALTYQGIEYPLRKHIQIVLLIGTDSLEQYKEQTEGLKSFYNYHQADFLMLLVLDPDDGSAQIIQLNRDTMTDVPWLDVLGKFGGTEYKQLCLAFNYGDGGANSCRTS